MDVTVHDSRSTVRSSLYSDLSRCKSGNLAADVAWTGDPTGFPGFRRGAGESRDGCTVLRPVLSKLVQAAFNSALRSVSASLFKRARRVGK